MLSAVVCLSAISRVKCYGGLQRLLIASHIFPLLRCHWLNRVADVDEMLLQTFEEFSFCGIRPSLMN